MRARHREQFVAWAERRSHALRAAAYLITADRHLAEDFTQEALTKTYMAWPRIRDVTKAEAYARTILTNTAISWSRKRSSDERPAESVAESLPATVGDFDGEVVTRDWIWSELARLPTRQRSMIVLRYYEDFSVDEVAAILDCAPGTVKSQVSRGLARMRQQVEPAYVGRDEEESR